MKILFHAYNTCCQTESGGVQVRVRKIKSLLEARGHQVDFFNAFDTKIKDYDVLHLFSLKEESLGIAACAKKLGLKVVISPIVNTTSSRARSVNNSIRFHRLFAHFSSESIEHQRYRILQICDSIFVESRTEAIFIEKYYRVDPKKINIVPNGVDEQAVAGKSIFSAIGKECKYVLQVGRIDSNKNTLNTIKSVKGAPYSLVIIGGKASWGTDEYYKQCVTEAKSYPNVYMLGWLEPGSELLASAYQNAQAVIMPSKSETFGLVAVEAAMAGAHVCLSNDLAILDFGVFKKEHTFNSSDIKDMRRVLDIVMETPKNNEVRSAAQRVFSWPQIIDEHIKTYNS